MLQKAIILLTIAALSVTAFAHKKGRKFEDNPELRAEIEAYKKENVLPVMLEWKQEIDNAMSTEDLEELNRLRAEAALLKAERKALKDQNKLAKENGEEIDREAVKAQMKELMAKMKEIAEQLKPIAEKYSDLLQTIAESSKEYHDDWKSDMKEIASAYKDEDADGEKRNKRRGKKSGHKADFEGEEEMGGKHKMVRLLLWDGNVEEGDTERINESGAETFQNNRSFENVNAQDKVNSLAYPNPTTGDSNINFDLKKDEYVTVRVYDQAGNLVETLYDGEMKSGMQNLHFDAMNSRAGTYIYRIESKTINETGKLILNK